MQTPSLNEIKKNLLTREAVDLSVLCLRLAKYKKENKELLSYLLFEAENEELYITDIQKELEMMFKEVRYLTAYKFAKQVRKILRYVSKHIKYSGIPSTEVELLMHFCLCLKPILSDHSVPAMLNLYQRQILKIEKSMGKLHEDIQYDYMSTLEELKLNSF